MRSKAFIYIIAIDGKESLVKATSRSRAIKAVLSDVSVRRATAVEVADYINAGAVLFNTTVETPKTV